jgi:hypothetical protein
MDKFRVGQRVIFKTCHWYPEVSGTVTTIAESRRECVGRGGFHLFAYTLDLPAPNGKTFVAEEWQLEPYYDGDEKSTWTECAWKPRQTERA